VDSSRGGCSEPPKVFRASKADQDAGTWSRTDSSNRSQHLPQASGRTFRALDCAASLNDLFDAADDAVETPVIDAQDRKSERAQLRFEVRVLRQRDDQIRMKRDERFVARGEVSTDFWQRECLAREPAITRYAHDTRSDSRVEEHLRHAWRERHDALWRGLRDGCR
jgi:hypothetical protein